MRVLPTPRVTRGRGLSSSTQQQQQQQQQQQPLRLCASRTVNFTVTVGPYNRSTCGVRSQVSAVGE
jgi:hypothetical protein